MTGPRTKPPGGKYADLIEAVEAMHVGDLLRWECRRELLASVRTRFTQMVPWKLWTQWHGGQIWIVRFE